MKNKDQLNLFEVQTDWQLEWNGMPEFSMDDLTSNRKIIVHFRNDDDFKRFAELINQRIGPKQPSIWYPEMPHRIASSHHYV
jgi:hypothetical protein